MTDLIRIKDLRSAFETRRQADSLASAVLALLDAVEAAHAHIVARRDRLPSEWPRLLTALDKFDFDE